MLGLGVSIFTRGASIFGPTAPILARRAPILGLSASILRPEAPIFALPVPILTPDASTLNDGVPISIPQAPIYAQRAPMLIISANSVDTYFSLDPVIYFPLARAPQQQGLLRNVHYLFLTLGMQIDVFNVSAFFPAHLLTLEMGIRSTLSLGNSFSRN